MNNPRDPETLKIPAFMRNKAIVSQSRQKLILTALDRKEANLSVHSKKATAVLPTHTLPKQLPERRRPVVSQLSSATSNYPLSRPARSLEPRSHFIQTPQPIDESESGKVFEEIGTTTHYLDKIQVAIIKLTSTLKQGELLLMQGEDCLFTQIAEEIQIDRKPVVRAKSGSHIGMKVSEEAVVNGKVYRTR